MSLGARLRRVLVALAVRRARAAFAKAKALMDRGTRWQARANRWGKG